MYQELNNLKQNQTVSQFNETIKSMANQVFKDPYSIEKTQ